MTSSEFLNRIQLELKKLGNRGRKLFNRALKSMPKQSKHWLPSDLKAKVEEAMASKTGSDLKQRAHAVRHNKTFVYWGLAALAMLILVISITGLRSAVRIDMALALPLGSHHSNMAYAFAEKVIDETEGQVVVAVYPRGRIREPDEIVAAVQEADIEAGEQNWSALIRSGYLRRMYQVPFLAEDYRNLEALYQLAVDDLDAALQRLGLKLLYTIPTGPVGLFTKNKLRHTQDFQGLKIQASETLLDQWSRILGMQVVAGDEGDGSDESQAMNTYQDTDLDTDLLFASAEVGIKNELWHHYQYFYDLRLAFLPQVAFMNEEVWQDMDPQQQQAVMRAAQAIQQQGWSQAQQLVDWHVEQISKQNMSIEKIEAPSHDDLHMAARVVRYGWLEHLKQADRSRILRYLEQR